MRIKNIQWLLLSVLVIVLDQFTKWLITAQVQLDSGFRVTPFLNIIHVRNYGAAFSLLNVNGGSQRWLFVALSSIISVVLFVWLLRMQKPARLHSAALALIIGGALGNLWGRLTQGYVVDFLDFHLAAYHWPAFNVADSAVCIGAVMLLWQLYMRRDK